jgi:UDP:flavonoid glycosyltransferase YjiC (YdhE family)/pimeloyl-ACP methyl ester carboxylesterase
MAEITARGITFNVQRLGRGDGPPVVFLHGLVMDNLSSWYFTVANRIAARAPVILYDLRGHGRSQRPATGYRVTDMVEDLAGLLDALDVASVQLCGNSFGGQLALAFAAAHPERVARIALCDAHIGSSGWGERMASTLELEGEARDRVIAREFQSWLGRHSQRKRTRLANAARELCYGTSLIADLRGSPALASSALQAIRCPVLALYGESSDVVGDGRALAELLPACTLRIVPGCSHSLLWEATASMRDALMDFMTEGGGFVTEGGGFMTEGGTRRPRPPGGAVGAPLPRDLPATVSTLCRTSTEPTRQPTASRASRRYLFVVPPLTGHINPAVSVAEALRARGHECAFVGHGAILQRLAPAGTRIFALDDHVPAAIAEAQNARANRARGAERLKFLWEEFFIPLARAMVPSVEAAALAYAPDVLVVDQQALAGAVVARRRGLRWATLATTPVGIIDPLATLPRVRAWLERLLGGLQLEHGLDQAAGIERSPELVIAFTTRELLGAAALPAEVELVGPALEHRPETVLFPWERLNCAPRVLVTLGTVNAMAGGRFFQEVADAARALPLQLIFVAPPGLIADPPDNAIIADVVPQLELLSRVDAVVCHGGHNTVVEAISRGKPLVVAPIKDDQPVIADQVLRAGAGLRVKFGRVRSHALSEAIGQVLEQPSFGQAAERIRASFVCAGGAARAASLIERLT